MSLNGSGVFTVNSSGQPVQSGTLITAAAFNAFTADVATALSTALYKDGQQTATANQAMGGFKHTNIADATARTQYASAGQAQDGALQYLTTVGGTNTITASVSPTPSAYAAGQRFSFIVGTTNTGAVTLNVSSLGAKSIKKKMSGGKVALVAADLIANQSAEVFYDGTDFILETARTYSHGADVASATTTDLDAVTGDLIDVTGTTAITAITLTEGEERTVRFTGILTLTNDASLVLPGGANITTAAGDFAVFRGYASGVVRCVTYARASGLPIVNPTVVNLRGYLSGCQLSTAGASTTMTIAAGTAADAGNAVMMELNSAIGKTTSAWAVGTGNGGIDTGAVANSTWYHFYLIRRPDTGVVDAVFSLSASAPTLPTNYTQYRRIGSGRTNGSGQWTSFTQTGDMFQWLDLVNDSATFAAINTTAANYVVTVPTGVLVEALLQVFISYNSNAIGARFFNPSLTDAAISSTSNAIGNFGITVANGTNVRPTADLRVLTNTSAQVRAVTDNAPNSIDVRTRGWIDQRGKN